MKLTNLIVDSGLNLIGFMVKGKAKEFGEMGNTECERPLSMKYLMSIRFNNAQAYFGNGNITEKGGFHINQLGMLRASGDTMEPVENTVKLTKRYVRNNENIGFDVKFGDGTTGRYKYADVMKLAELFRPDNFVVKVNNSGKQFLAGKSNEPIGDLPAEVIEFTTGAKRTKSGAKPISPVTGKLENTVDILDVFEFVNSCDGYIINFNDTVYEATGDTVEKLSSKFTPLGVGEVANPKLEFSESKFNASCKFKKPGVLTLDAESSGPVFAGSGANMIYTYVYRSKNLFYNGEHHMKRLGVILPAAAEHDLFEKFSESMAITEVKDENVIAVVNRLINWKNSKIFEVDTSKLDLIAPDKYSKLILGTSDLYKHTYNLAVSKIKLQYIRGAIKELAGLGYVSAPKNRPIAAQFALKSEAELEKLIADGVDVFTGAYTEKGEEVANTHSKSGDTSVEISYIIDGLDPKNYNYKKLCETDKCPEPVAVMVSQLQKIENMNTRLQAMNELMKKLDSSVYNEKRTLWLHKTSMWLSNKKLSVHKDDADKWEINTKKRTKAICYDCKEPSAAGLQLLVTGIDIAG